ncbi:hypothetical protein O181_053599 [Austropuccinia psidii MF-1]|uniref:Uncharacterized protein n=1 Tax=Austropuccinia psidii MF-1 TaxID=1389203 RepID=A0A9Q3E2X2_9BASI|nr:hypothetical protein [Austropuccinia psidii MF-1]
MEGESLYRKEGRVPRRLNSFSGGFGAFPGISKNSLKGLGENDGEEKNSGEEEGSDATEVVPAPVGESQGTGGPSLAQSNKPFSNQSESSLLAIMHQITHIMANIKAASSFEASRKPAFKTPSMKAPNCFYGIEPLKVRSFIQCCQPIFHNYQERFCEYKKKSLHATSFPI